MPKKQFRKIPSKYYSKKYFLSRYFRSFEEYKQFKQGLLPPKIFLQAFERVPSTAKGPFLDVGCGRGELVIYLARLGKKSYGLDYSQDGINICCENLKREKKGVQKLVRFERADCTKLPYKNNAFECLFLLDVIEHLTPAQLHLALREANRVLKSNGIIIIHTNNKYFEKFTKILIPAIYHGIKVFLKPAKTFQDIARLNPYEYMHINYMSGEEARDLLTRHGFNDMRSKNDNLGNIIKGVDYIRPKNKAEINKHIFLEKGWKQFFYHNIAWILLNSPLLKFLSPTYWIVMKKKRVFAN